MKAVEFSTHLKNGKIEIPRKLRKEYKKNDKCRVILLFDDSDEEEAWKKASLKKFFKDDSKQDSIYDTL